MKFIYTIVAFFVLYSISFSQDATKVALIHENSYDLIDAENQAGVLYVSLFDFVNKLPVTISAEDKSAPVKLIFENHELYISSNNPFVTIIDLRDSSAKTLQLSSPPYTKKSKIYISLISIVDLINKYWNKELIPLAANRIKIVNKVKESVKSEWVKSIQISSISIEYGPENVLFKIKSNGKIDNFYSFYRSQNLHLILWNTTISNDSALFLKSKEIVDRVEINNGLQFLECKFFLNEKETITEVYEGKEDNELIIRISKRDFGDWYSKESEHFKIIYRDAHSHLVNHILSSAENSLAQLKKLFDYQPKEKIIINTYDVSDFGFGATTTIPENYIRLEIEPLEPGYEMVPYSERFQWLLSHELVHIIVNDMASNFESSLRSVMGKVTPDKNQPLTVFYSLLTNHNRYTPRWYQEAIAVFIETWFSGGYGRILGNFDEMYFRSLVDDNQKFASASEIENVTSHESILLENILYLYGTRFIANIANKYGTQKLYNWFSIKPDEFYPGLESKFEKVYGIPLSDAWENFIADEKQFQNSNISLIKKYPLTEFRKLSDKPFGWVTHTTYDSKNNSLIFGYHRKGELAEIQKFNLDNKESSYITTLPTPSLIQVAAVAYDESYKKLFYTTNNNQLYRDVWEFDLNNNKEKLLFKDSRIGQLTISPSTHELWGIQHLSGKAILIRSKYPYSEFQSLSVFDVGDEFSDLSINKKGNLLAAVLHRSSGQQSIIISDITGLEKGYPFQFRAITSSGSPENPSWSLDGKYLYWNAYTNGVSNIYRYDLQTEEIIALTNTIKGFFKPMEVSKDSIIAMEFSLDGFTPVKFGISKADKLPAINYFGQKILDKSPELYELNLKPANKVIDKNLFTKEESYSSLSDFSIKTFIPVVSGFQSRVVLGLFTQFNDPLLNHDLVIEAGVSPFKETTKDIKFHFRLKYSYHQKLTLSIEQNAPDFYDLFNTRKRGMLGGRYSVGYNHYWIFDNPLKVKQMTELSIYRGIKFINDNLTEVRQPDFAILKSELEIRDLRKTIGSIDWESGDLFKFSVLAYGSNPDDPQFSGQLMGEWDKYFLFLTAHNVLHLKAATGYHFINDNIPETMFFFGGFGNREIENEPVKQFEKMFRFPGVPIYSITSDKFLKVMVENSLPPVRIPDLSFSSIEFKNINVSIFSQGLISDSREIDKAVNLGAQLNIMFQHWYNLESTVSTGFAKAWWRSGNDTEWFISWKLLKD
ncbi:MAG TPA: hypothetical protein VF870_10905 [Ignavibacteriaceae bacterium]